MVVPALPADPAHIREQICAHYSIGALVERTAEQLCKLVPDGTIEWRVAPD